MPVVGSFYLKKPPDSGGLCFENPMEILLKHQPLEKIYKLERSNYDTMLDHEVNASEGDLVLFPGYLKHYTQPNQSNQDRIIIGVMLDQNYRTRING
jgi:ectoine hydroxylase-related dioxygenase (phytanoyl-CoA dioxygenase family)